jgi:hypothetical protein
MPTLRAREIVMLEYKDDWERAKARLTAWYQCEVIDRCAMIVTAPKRGVERRTIEPPGSVVERWTNLDYVMDVAEERMRCTFYGAEAHPMFRPGLGPSVFAAWLGSEITFSEDTSWAKPCINDWNDFRGLHFDRENRWWQWLLKATLVAAERGRGRYIVAVVDLHAGADALGALRGVENFCTDLVDAPDRIRECELYIRRMWFEAFDELYGALTSCGQEGTGSWLSWGPGKAFPLAEDALALISPRHFREFFYDALVEQAAYLDSKVFHVDGPEALPSLDLVLDIPKLQGIQWEPGAAHLPILQWIPLIRRIQSHGKCVCVNAEPCEVETMLGELSAKGLLLKVECQSEGEARELIRKAEKWTKDNDE